MARSLGWFLGLAKKESHTMYREIRCWNSLPSCYLATEGPSCEDLSALSGDIPEKEEVRLWCARLILSSLVSDDRVPKGKLWRTVSHRDGPRVPTIHIQGNF